MNDHLLSIDNLSISFRTYRGILEATHKVSLFVDAGETVGIVGESGCGKSVTAHAVMKLLPRDSAIYSSGRISWDGRDIISLDEGEMNRLRGRDMAMIFQDPMTALNPVLTIGNQIEEGLRHHAMSRQEAEQKALSLLQEVGITSPERRLHQYPHELSGGMRQRCLIAMALSCEPKLLIADEPTTALDVTIQEQILNLIAELNERMGMSVLFITHDLGAMAQLCHSVRVMYLGNLVEEARTEELFARPMHPYTQGLLDCIPRLDSDRSQQLHVISGVVPPLSNVPDGCRFCTRCPYADQRCMSQNPPSVEVFPEHKAKCWKYTPEQEAE